MKKTPIDITYTRTSDTMERYITTMKERKQRGVMFDFYTTTRQETLIEFDHWFIAPNDFPYDAIAEINHMIIPKRKFPFDWSLMNEDEYQELNRLRNTYFNEHYDVLYENLPGGQTMPDCFHLHLLKLKRTKK